MIERTKNFDSVESLIEEYAEEAAFSRIRKSEKRNMPVASHTKAKSGRRRFGKRHSFSENGAHKRYRRRSLHKKVGSPNDVT